MIGSLTVRRGWAALLAATALLLSACGGGGGGGGGTASLRLLNVTNDVASVDLYLAGVKTFSAADSGAVNDYLNVDATSYSVKVTGADDPATLFSGSYALSKNTKYTGIVWGRTGSMNFVTLPESEDVAQIDDGNTQLRVYNATSGSGAVDVYLTQGIDDLAFAQPTRTSVTAGGLSGFTGLTAGNYRLRVTSAGNANDVRLDIAAVALPNKNYATLIITAGAGGVLVNSALLVQQGAVTEFKNTKARVRVAAGVDAGGSVSMSIAGGAVASSLSAPFVSPYTLIDAGNLATVVSVDGTTISSATRSFAAGGDYTLLAFGTGGGAQASFLADDNRLPASGSYRVRLVHGAADTLPLSLKIAAKYVVGLTDVPVGTASPYAAAAVVVDPVTLQVSAGSSPLAPLDAVDLMSQGVYTIFVLGGAGTPTPLLSQDR